VERGAGICPQTSSRAGYPTNWQPNLTGPRVAVKNGRDEAGCRSRGTRTGQGNGRAKANDRSVCFDTGHRRVDHRGSTACEGDGHQQAIASTDIRDNGQRWAGENDSGKNRALDSAKMPEACSSRSFSGDRPQAPIRARSAAFIATFGICVQIAQRRVRLRLLRLIRIFRIMF